MYEAKGERTAAMARKVTNASVKVAVHPRAAAGGALVGLGAAGAGLAGAGMAHNARSNQIARQYNAGGRNSKIKIVPVTAKNRF